MSNRNTRCLLSRFVSCNTGLQFHFQCNAQEGMEGNASAKTIKNVSRGFAALSIPFTASFPQVCGAAFIYGKLCIVFEFRLASNAT